MELLDNKTGATFKVNGQRVKPYLEPLESTHEVEVDLVEVPFVS